ncbi:hypothetical protein LTR85_006073 [Meristemomyces frigidus]|nr:hypothetical protein LTR85_006073 [Meristemomyces frigidus]
MAIQTDIMIANAGGNSGASSDQRTGSTIGLVPPDYHSSPSVERRFQRRLPPISEEAQVQYELARQMPPWEQRFAKPRLGAGYLHDAKQVGTFGSERFLARETAGYAAGSVARPPVRVEESPRSSTVRESPASSEGIITLPPLREVVESNAGKGDMGPPKSTLSLEDLRNGQNKHCQGIRGTSCVRAAGISCDASERLDATYGATANYQHGQSSVGGQVGGGFDGGGRENLGEDGEEQVKRIELNRLV